MFSFKNFNTVARFESKTLMRSLFFRIFTIIGLVVILLFNILLSQQNFSPWVVRGLPTNIPYATLLIFNVIQAVIAVFLATDFMKRDKNQDTTEVIYVRPVSNGEYIWGKVYGQLRVILALNVLILIIPFIITLVTQDMTLNPLGYGLYFVLISIPTLVFIFGLSFFLMAWIRNQAVVMLALLGYIALTLFYLEDKFYYIFDYISFNIPMIWSEFTGLANLHRIILLKTLYISLGISLIFFTVLLIKRLRQSSTNYWISITGGILFLGIASYLATNHINQEISMRQFRSELIKLNDQYLKNNVPVVDKYNIELAHKEQTVDITTGMTVYNSGDEALDTLIFSLNPGFEVNKCLVNSQENKYTQKQHLVILNKDLPAGDTVKVSFHYSGNPDERICYLDVPNSLLFRGESMFLFQLPKKFSFLTSDYLMFTPELLWYPIPGTGFSSKNVSGFRKNFSEYQLKVETSDNMTVLSQGKAERQDQKWNFHPRKPLSCMSVIIGDYQRDSTTVDSTTYNVYYKKHHDMYRPFFNDITDTIPSLINRVMDDYEADIHLDYPFEDFSVVEVPAHFYAYKKNFTLASEASLPQMALMRERAFTIRRADFPRYFERYRRRRGDDRTREEMKADMFRNFIHSNFIEGESLSRGWFSGSDVTGNTKIFPNFISYCNDFGMKELPVMNTVLERYIDKRASEDSRHRFSRDGVGAKERANLLLQENSFAELMSDTSNFVRLSDVIDVKGDYFINLMNHFAGEVDFEAALDSFIVATRYQNNTGKLFLNHIEERYQINTKKYINDWLYAKQLPAYTFEDVEAYSYYKEENPRYQAEITITNRGGGLGLVNLNMRVGERRNRRLAEELTITLGPGQSKRVGLNVSESPSMLLANTFVSSNMPSIIRFPLRDIEEESNAGGGTFIKKINQPNPNEEAIIVDNEDPSFRFLDPDKATKLRDILKDDKDQYEYTDINVWRPPEEWQKAIDNKFYGKIKLSAGYVRSGDGKHKAEWKVPVKNAGNYEVQVYVSDAGLHHRWRRRRNNNNEDKLYHYTIFHGDEEETISVDVEKYNGNWVPLGEFYFSADSARIQISNKSKAQTVVADAVKLVQK